MLSDGQVEKNVFAVKTRGNTIRKKTLDVSNHDDDETSSGLTSDVCVAGVAGGLNVKGQSSDISLGVLYNVKNHTT